MKKHLLTIAISFSLAAPFAQVQAADNAGSCNTNFSSQRQQEMQVRFDARQAEVQKMRAAFHRAMPMRAARVLPQQQMDRAAVKKMRQAREEQFAKVREQQQQMQAWQQHMQQLQPYAYTGMPQVELADVAKLREQTPEQRRAYLRELAEKRQAQSKQRMEEQQKYVHNLQAQMEKFSPAAQHPAYKQMQERAAKHNAAFEKRRAEFEQQRQQHAERKSCESKA
jgi:hypothetical protein